MAENRIIEMITQKNLMPRKQRLLCEFFLHNVNSIMSLTAEEVAKQAQVGKATLFRLIHQIGYDSFTDFRADLYQYSLHNIRPNYWQMQQMINNNHTPTLSALQKSVECCMITLSTLVTPTVSEAFEAAVREILAAPQLAIIGLRSSKQVATYFSSLLLPTPIQVINLCHEEHFIFDKISKLPAQSAVFVVSRWPYTSTTIEAAQYAHSLGQRVLLLTNNVTSSVRDFADVIILTPKEENRYSIVPFITVIEALVDELCLYYQKDTIATIQKIDQVLQTKEFVKW